MSEPLLTGLGRKVSAPRDKRRASACASAPARLARLRRGCAPQPRRRRWVRSSLPMAGSARPIAAMCVEMDDVHRTAAASSRAGGLARPALSMAGAAMDARLDAAVARLRCDDPPSARRADAPPLCPFGTRPRRWADFGAAAACGSLIGFRRGRICPRARQCRIGCGRAVAHAPCTRRAHQAVAHLPCGAHRTRRPPLPPPPPPSAATRIWRDRGPLALSSRGRRGLFRGGDDRMCRGKTGGRCRGGG